LAPNRRLIDSYLRGLCPLGLSLNSEERTTMTQLDLIDYGHSFGHLEKPKKVSNLIKQIYDDIQTDEDLELLEKEINYHSRYLEVRFKDNEGYLLKMRIEHE